VLVPERQSAAADMSPRPPRAKPGGAPYVASSGVEVTREAFQLWDVRNCKAIRCEMFDQEAEALAAVGRGVTDVGEERRDRGRPLFWGCAGSLTSYC